MLLEVMAGRQLLRLAAAAMHVPPLHAAQLEAVEQLPAAAIAAAAAAMQQPLLAGVSSGHRCYTRRGVHALAAQHAWGASHPCLQRAATNSWIRTS